MTRSPFLRPAIITGLILLIPLYGEFYIEGWNWGLGGFIFAFVAIFGSCLTYELVSRKAGSMAYKLAVAIACVTGFLVFWVNAAVGIIGEDNPANVLFGVVFFIGILGAVHARLAPKGMADTLFAMAITQMLVPVAGLFIDPGNFSPGVPGVFLLNAFFAAAWIVSGLLFRRAAKIAA